MLTLLLFGLSLAAEVPIPWYVYLATSFVDGLAFVPVLSLAAAPYLGKLIRTKWARLHFLQGTVTADGTALVGTATGYELAPLEGDSAVLSDGRRLDLSQDDDVTWYRLGKRRFAITWTDKREQLGTRIVDPDADFQTSGRDPEQGVALLESRRGGEHGFTHYPDGAGDDSILVSLSREINRLRGASGPAPEERQTKNTKKEHGGGSALSTKWRVVGAVTSMAMGATVGILVFGVL